MSETYTIQPGDSLSKIAREHGMSLDVLIKANPQIDNPNLIHPGLVIKIPMKTLKKAKAKVFKNKAHAAATTYEVKPGDYLSKIAAEHNISLQELIKANPKLKDNPSLIHPGQKIVIPPRTASAYAEKETETRKPDKKSKKIKSAQKTKTPKIHTIAAGETLYGIARKYGISYNALINANPQFKENPSLIQPGQMVKIPAADSASAEKKKEYTAAEGKKTIEAATVRHELAKLSYIGMDSQENFGNNIALTFDDGPDPENTPIVLDILKKYGIKATFFVLGCKAKEYPQLIRRIVGEGHTLGNHTYNHPQRLPNKRGSRRITELEPHEIEDEIVKTQKAVDGALGKHYPLKQFRSPGGHCNEKVASVARKMGITEIVKWNVTSNDWAHPGSKKIMSNVEKGAREKGGVILFHDNHSSCVAKTGDSDSPTVLEKIIQDMQKEGYNFKTVDELIKMKTEKKKA